MLQAIGGSTNALVHLTAVARRLGIEIDLEEFDAIGRKVPVLVDLKPSGDHYMEHFHQAGGNSRLMAEIRDLIDSMPRPSPGKTLKQVIDARRDGAGPDRHPHARRIRSSRTAAWRCCAATSRRAAP